MEKTEEKVIAITGMVLGVSALKLNSNSTFKKIKNWDSMNHLKLILALEEEFDIKFPDSMITKIQGIADIIKIVQKYSGKKQR